MTIAVPGIGTLVTAQDLVTRAMKALGALGSNEVPSATEATDGLVALNTMLDSWAGEELASYQVLEQSVVLTVGKSQYTIGTVGTPDINVDRPLAIVQAYIQDTNGLRYLMKVVPRDKWNQIGQLTITSQIPNTLFYDPQFPLGVLNLYPVPLQPWTLFYDSMLQQALFTALTTQLSAPPGYTRAYVLNLALEMMNVGFHSMLSPPDLDMLVKNAADAKANIKRNNIATREVIANYDSAIVSHSYASYNIYSDRGA
jgi:hypothetical protein